jgi:hypothetical protein
MAQYLKKIFKTVGRIDIIYFLRQSSKKSFLVQTRTSNIQNQPRLRAKLPHFCATSAFQTVA